MSIGIIGAGHIGGNLAYALASVGEKVLIAGSGSAQATASKIGMFDHVVAVTAVEAAGADLVALALPWGQRKSLTTIADRLAGKIVLDITNPYKSDMSGIEDLGGERSSVVIARLIPGGVDRQGPQHPLLQAAARRPPTGWRGGPYRPAGVG